MGDEEATPADETEAAAETGTQQDAGSQQSGEPGQDTGGIQPDSLYHE